MFDPNTDAAYQLFLHFSSSLNGNELASLSEYLIRHFTAKGNRCSATEYG